MAAGTAEVFPADLPPLLPQRCKPGGIGCEAGDAVNAYLRPGSMLAGDVLADARAGKTPEQIATARRIPVAVVEATIQREHAACAAERARRDAAEETVDLEIARQRRTRGRPVW